MAKFWKLWGMIGGSIVGAVFSALAVYGLANCTDINVVDTCTVLGLSPAVASTIITTIFGAIGTVVSPKNAT
jgi:hypothetical protein